MNFWLARDQVVLLETAANLWVTRVSQRKANDFFAVLSSFELGGVTKHLMTGPAGNSEFCFPSTSMFPSASLWNLTLRVSGKKLTVSLGATAYCYLARLSLNKTSTVVGWFLVTCPWSNSNVSIAQLLPTCRHLLTKHFMYGTSGN